MELEELIEQCELREAQLKIMMCAINALSDETCKKMADTLTSLAALRGAESRREELLEPPSKP